MDIDIKDLQGRFIRYCSLEENLSPRTVKSIKSSLNTFFLRAAVTNLDQITLDLLKEFFYEGKEKYHWSPSSTINYRKYLKKFFNWCILEDYLAQNLIFKIKPPKVPHPLPRVLTKDQANKLLNAAFSYNWQYTFEQYRNYAIIGIFLFGGLRASELLDLHFTDINLGSGRIFVKEGKGKKDRYVPIYKKLHRILVSYIHERNRLNKNSEYFFTGVQSNLHLNYKDLSRICQKLSKFIQIKFTPHVLRHTAATELLNNGLDIYMVSRILGHTDIKTTTIYLHTATKDLQNSMNQLDLY